MTSGFWLQVLAAVIASAPVFLAGLWVSHRSLRAHVDRKTDAQTGAIAELTAEQTGVIKEITAEQTSELRDTWPPQA